MKKVFGLGGKSHVICKFGRRISLYVPENPLELPEFRSQNFILCANLYDRNLLEEWLVGKRNKGTRREYAKELKKFFLSVCDRQLTATLVMQFLQMERFSAATLVLRYKAQLIYLGLKEASVNRSIAAIKSLVNYAYSVGQCTWTLADIKSEKVKPYRDTTGIGSETFKKMLAVPDRETLKGKRDFVLLVSVQLL